MGEIRCERRREMAAISVFFRDFYFVSFILKAPKLIECASLLNGSSNFFWALVSISFLATRRDMERLHSTLVTEKKIGKKKDKTREIDGNGKKTQEIRRQTTQGWFLRAVVEIWIIILKKKTQKQTQ